MPRPLHDMFCLRLGTDAFFPIETLWTFHFYQTGAHIEIVRPADAIAASPLSPELLAQELTYKYIVRDCSYEWLEYSMSPSVPKTYQCDLYVAKCNAEGDATEVCLSFVLSPRRGITANAKECTIPEMVKGYAFRDPVQLRLEPLTCGKYTVEGAVNGDGRTIPAVVHLELLPEGRLVGRSEEFSDEAGLEMIPLTGSWARNTIEFFKAYELEDGARDVFLYRGQVSQFGFKSQWVAVDSEDVQPVALVSNQHFDLHVTKMQRRWSPQEHSLFPDEFREAVKLCLLSSLREGSSSLPGVVWVHVFGFCDSEWFFDENICQTLAQL